MNALSQYCVSPSLSCEICEPKYPYHIATSRSHEVVSKIFRTGAVIYTAVVVARSTGPNRPNCGFRVLLRRFAATAWKRAKTSL
jgi:hypothetical protein